MHLNCELLKSKLKSKQLKTKNRNYWKFNNVPKANLNKLIIRFSQANCQAVVVALPVVVESTPAQL